MKFSNKSNYAIASILFMLKNKNTYSVFSLNEVANKLNISKKYLEQIFVDLKKSNFLISIKGKNGGYKLNDNINSTTLLDILMLTETKFLNFDVSTNDNVYLNYIQHFNISINHNIRNILSSTKIITLFEEFELNDNFNLYTYYI